MQKAATEKHTRMDLEFRVQKLEQKASDTLPTSYKAKVSFKVVNTISLEISCLKQINTHSNTHTHAHTHIYIYIYIHTHI